MAERWIKYVCGLPERPEVVWIAVATGLDRFAVSGRLLHIWAWADENTTDGTIVIGSRKCNDASVTEKFIDELVGTPGFAAAMKEVGWLEAVEGGVSFPDFSRHNGQTAKTRAKTALRVNQRRTCTENVTMRALQKAHKCNDVSVTKSAPDKIREEKNTAAAPNYSEQVGGGETHPPTDEVGAAAGFCGKADRALIAAGIDLGLAPDLREWGGHVDGVETIRRTARRLRAAGKQTGAIVLELRAALAARRSGQASAVEARADAEKRRAERLAEEHRVSEEQEAERAELLELDTRELADLKASAIAAANPGQRKRWLEANPITCPPLRAACLAERRKRLANPDPPEQTLIAAGPAVF